MTDIISKLVDVASGSEPIDLSVPANRKHIARLILDDIDDYCRVTYDDGHRNHLGASQIGHVCSRHLWYVFRWVQRSQFNGRMQRLFNRGHREEARFIEWLRGVGFKVWDVSETGEQFRVKACLGHFGGSLDGVNVAPEKYRINKPMLCEFKTSGTGSGFEKLKKEGVKSAKPVHFIQMCIYGKNYGFHYALYCCINKNDDDLYIEIVALDWSLAEQNEKKAMDVIAYRVAPTKYALSEAVFECKYCDFKEICHLGAIPEKNCRSCTNSEAVDNAEWFCHAHNAIIPKDFIPQGCDNWNPVE